MKLRPYSFKPPAGRPFIFTSFVSTLDGKIIVKDEGYWPIGSPNDYAFFTHLRAHADVILDGKNTALMFGKKTIETIHRPEFQQARRSFGKKELAEYAVITSHPDESLASALENDYDFKPYIVKSLEAFMELCRREGWKTVFIDGGPTLITSLLAEGLLDEIFLTITPKIFGSEEGKTLTMAEGRLFSPDAIKKCTLIELDQEGDEVFLRYRVK